MSKILTPYEWCEKEYHTTTAQLSVQDAIDYAEYFHAEKMKDMIYVLGNGIVLKSDFASFGDFLLKKCTPMPPLFQTWFYDKHNKIYTSQEMYDIFSQQNKNQ